MLSISAKVNIPLEEFEFTFARSGGPGGQNVNKVNSKAIMRWPVATSPSVPEDVKERFILKFGNRITSDGELILFSQKYRDQSKNIDCCLEKLKEMMLVVLVPAKKRKRTKPSLASQMQRVDSKKLHARKKASRRRPSSED